ncbi:MAG: hypothetical protein IJV13_02765 [Prevotella sp.]|nr:hypothetical protein [Prevotella sp.]
MSSWGWRADGEDMGLKSVFNAVGSAEKQYQQFTDVSRETGNEKIMHPLEWWKNRRGIKQDAQLRCANYFCSNPAEVGAHVIDTKTGKHVYIVPTCKSCNNKGDVSYYVTDKHLEECTNIKPQHELIQKSDERLEIIKKKDIFRALRKMGLISG